MLLRRPTPHRRLSWFRLGAVAPLAASLWLSCATTSGPEAAVERYARALERGNLDEAYAQLTATEQQRIAVTDFKARYESDALRRSRAATLRASLGGISAQTPAVQLERDTDRWRISENLSRVDPRDALLRFLEAAEHRDFDTAYALLSASWRALYTPKQLAADFGADPNVDARLQRARLALSAAPKVSGEIAEYDLGAGKAVRLVREADGYKLAALE